MDIEKKVKEIGDYLKDNIEYISVGGSRMLPFIRNPKDYDIIIVCKDKPNLEEAIRLFKLKYNKEELRESFIDTHFRTLEQGKVSLLDSVYCYLLYYEKAEQEQILKESLTIDKIKENVINRYSRFKAARERKANLSLYDSKLWYYMYTSICIINNNSYELTEEQIDNINILHDRKEEDIEVRKQLIDTMIEEIEEWQI